MPPSLIHRQKYNYDHQNDEHNTDENGNYNTDVSDVVWVRNKVYSYIYVATVQLNSNLTFVFDCLRVFTDFIRVSDQYLHVFCE